MKLQSNIGLLLLSIFLILTGLSSLFALPIPGILMGLLALISGALILIGK